MGEPEPAAEADLPDELVIPLRKAVSLGEIVYDKLVLREPTGAEWEQWDKLGAGIEADHFAIALVSGVPLPAVKKIGARDLRQAARYISRFLA